MSAAVAVDLPLDGGHRAWPETNCYMDLWLTLLGLWGEEPRACLGYLAAVGFDGDGMTFAKPPHGDLEALHGVRIEELVLWRPIEAHLLLHAPAGRTVLLEVDGHWLPDTAGTGYRTGHAKTTVAVLGVDAAAGRLDYVHNRGRHGLEGADYRGVLWQDPAPPPGWLPPYAEIATREAGAGLRGGALVRAALDVLRRHLARAPRAPFEAFAAALEGDLASLRGGGPELFHLWAFATLRQAGAAFDLLGVHAAWLGAELGVDAGAPVAACASIATGAKTLQFRAARAARGGAVAGLRDGIAALGEAHRAVLDGLARAFG